MSDFFEYWTLPSSYNETTRIIRCYKDGKYIVFTRDDGKECKYNLSTGEVIGFRGKPVKRLASQLKDLTCDRLFEITDNPVYRKYFEWVWKWHSNGKAWVFFEFTMPKFKDYEQFFTSGFTNIENRFKYGYSETPKGLIKLCTYYDITLTNKLAKSYLQNPDAFNILYEIDFGKCTTQKMIEAMVYGCSFKVQRKPYMSTINEHNLLLRTKKPVKRKKPVNDTGRDSYYISLVESFNYNPKLLLEYIDSVKIGRRFKLAIFQDVYDYADMMSQIYDSYDKYPANFTAAHRKAIEEYNRLSIDYDEDQYTERNVLDYECEIDGFKFIYPKNTRQIKEEGKNQHNCVSTYINRVLYEGCHIMFMRPVKDTDHSYITLEIRNNKIVQAKRKYNNKPSKSELEVINKWNEKYKNFELR